MKEMIMAGEDKTKQNRYNITGDFEKDEEDSVDKTKSEDDTIELETEEEQEEENENSSSSEDDSESKDEGTSEDEDEGKADGEETSADHDGEVDITLEGEEPEDEGSSEEAPQWVKDLRRQNRDNIKRLKQLEEENARLKKPDEGIPLVGEKPTLEGCEWDETEFERQLAEWFERKRVSDQKAKEAEDNQRAMQEAWNKKVSDYEAAKKTLKFPGMDDAEEIVRNTLSNSQYGSIIQGAQNPAALVAVIGKDLKRVEELAKINDPVEFIFAVARLEAKLKVTPRKTKPATTPEKRIKPPAHNAQNASQTLERLREEASKSGDYTKVHEFKRQQRANASK
jgi:hypothetical protein